jgi:hypothetical protein
MCSATGISAMGSVLQIAGRNESESYQKLQYGQEIDANQQLRSAALLKGEADVAKQRTATDKLMGTQRAQMGSSGLQANSGTFGKISMDTAATGELDAQTIKRNALMQAWSYDVKNQQLRMKQERIDAEAPYKNWTTFLGGNSSAIGSIGSNG